MLGETYEIVDGDVLCLCEQVSHHPPITATYITNPKLGWRLYTQQLAKSHFKGTYIDITMEHNIYIEFD